MAHLKNAFSGESRVAEFGRVLGADRKRLFAENVFSFGDSV
jgi:hypothetical protein